MFLCIANCIQRTYKFIIKRSNCLNPSLICEITAPRPPRNESSLETPAVRASVRGKGEGGHPSTLFFHSYFSHLVWIPSSGPPPPRKNLLGVTERKQPKTGISGAVWFAKSTVLSSPHLHTHTPRTGFHTYFRNIISQQYLNVFKKKHRQAHRKNRTIWHLWRWCHCQPWLCTGSRIQLWLESLSPPNAI